MSPEGSSVELSNGEFSLLNALLFQPLNARNPDQLVRVYTSEGRVQQQPSDRS